MGFHPVNFGLPKHFRSSKVEARDRQTDGQIDTGHHLIMTTPYGCRGHKNSQGGARRSSKMQEVGWEEVVFILHRYAYSLIPRIKLTYPKQVS